MKGEIKMEQNGYVVTICLLSACLCAGTLQLGASIFASSLWKDVKSENEGLSVLAFINIMIAFGVMCLITNSAIVVRISELPFWLQATLIVILAIIDSVEALLSICALEYYSTQMPRGGCGVGNSDFKSD